MCILQTHNLKKYYGTEPNITHALDGVNFSVEQGEFVAVVGTSGSGKSTLLHMMGGLDTPTSGSVVVREQELAKMNDEELTIFRRRNIGFIFQNYNLAPILNVYENIVLPVELDGNTVDWIFLDEIVRMLALEDKLKNMPNNLSRQQVNSLYSDEHIESIEVKETKKGYEAQVTIVDAVKMTQYGFSTVVNKLTSKYGIRHATKNDLFMDSLPDGGLLRQENFVLVGIAVFVIIVSALVVYNIFYLSIINQVQQFGQFRTIGMTQKQVKK